MIKINLIPVRQRIRSSPTNRILAIAGILILFICFTVYANQILRELAAKNAIANTEAVYSILSQSKEKINILNKYKQFKDAKSSQLIKFTAQRVPWSSLLAELSYVMPQQVKMLSLNGGGQVVQDTPPAKGAAPAKSDAKSDNTQGQASDNKSDSSKTPVKSGANDNLTHIIMSCEADSYAVVAQFIDILNGSKRFTKPVVSGLASKDDSNSGKKKISFTVDVTASFK